MKMENICQKCGVHFQDIYEHYAVVCPQCRKKAKYQIFTHEGWVDSNYRPPISFHHWEDWGGIHDVPCDEQGNPVSLLQGDDERWVEMTSDESE